MVRPNSLFIFSVFLCSLLLHTVHSYPKQYTFEVPNHQKFCLYEKFNVTKKYILSYRVIRGGHNDIDVLIQSEKGQKVHEKTKSHFETVHFDTVPGIMSFCFSNEFSTIAHKQVFFELRPEVLESLQEESGQKAVPSAETLIESALESVHSSLATIEEYQTDYRARETEGRALSEDLNERVFFWSALVAIAIVLTGFGQVTILKNFFPDTKSTYGHHGSRPPTRKL